MDPIVHHMQQVKSASTALTTLSLDQRHAVLSSLANKLVAHSAFIQEENVKDLSLMSQNDPRYDRLLLTPERIQDMAHDIQKVITLPDPLHHILLEKVLPNGLRLKKITVPLGVVGVIYESRPNVTIDVFTLCFKAGNACILKGGKEAAFTNMALMNMISRVLIEHNIASEIAYLLPAKRNVINIMLNATNIIDVCIPRGSQALIDFVRENAKIPVIETGAGIVHIYFDLSADLSKGIAIIENAKTRRVSVCNALDTLLIHEQRLPDLRLLTQPLAEKNVEIYADAPSYQVLHDFYPTLLLHKATPGDYGKEFLSLKMAIKTVQSYDQAVKHIQSYSSSHSEAIIAQDEQICARFLADIDAAAVYVNASTAFTDGGEFGMGAEIGISTQKLHARGPMGLDALTSYKWLIYGNGQIRGS